MRRVHLECHPAQPLTCGLVLQGTQFVPANTSWGPSAVLLGTNPLTLITQIDGELFADPRLGVAPILACSLAPPCASLPTCVSVETSCSTVSHCG